MITREMPYARKGSRGFNKSQIFRIHGEHSDYIAISHKRSIDRLQLSLRSHYADRVLHQLKSMCRMVRTIKQADRFIYEFAYHAHRIQFVQWSGKGMPVYYYSILALQPDIKVQLILKDLIEAYHMILSQVEVAYDFIPDDPYDLSGLSRAIPDGIVLKHSRAGCYSKCHETEYIGKNGNVRKGSKGLRIYKKEQAGRHFLRVELQLNRDFIKRKEIHLPVNADDFPLFNFVDYRKSLDEDRLLKVLCERWANPIRRAADVRRLRSLQSRGIHSWILASIILPSDSESDQISRFKQNLYEHEDLMDRVDWFFPKSCKRSMILEDIQNGVVRREY